MTFGDAFKPVRRGEPLRVPARAWNAMLNAVGLERRHPPVFAGQLRPAFHEGAIRVRNVTESDIGLGGCLCLTGGACTHPLVLDADLPAGHGVRFKTYVVTLDMIPAGDIGWACAHGICVVRYTGDAEAESRLDPDKDGADSTLAIACDLGRMLCLATFVEDETDYAVVDLHPNWDRATTADQEEGAVTIGRTKGEEGAEAALTDTYNAADDSAPQKGVVLRVVFAIVYDHAGTKVLKYMTRDVHFPRGVILYAEGETPVEVDAAEPC